MASDLRDAKSNILKIGQLFLLAILLLFQYPMSSWHAWDQAADEGPQRSNTSHKHMRWNNTRWTVSLTSEGTKNTSPLQRTRMRQYAALSMWRVGILWGDLRKEKWSSSLEIWKFMGYMNWIYRLKDRDKRRALRDTIINRSITCLD